MGSMAAQRGMAGRIVAPCLTAALLATLPSAVSSQYVVRIGVLVALFAALALSMNLLFRIGQLSLAHGPIMGLGAYTSALLTMRLDVPFILAMPAAGLAAGLVALLLGPVFLRIKGVYFALLTFALGQVILLNFVEWVDLFGGNSGLAGVPPAALLGVILAAPRQYYWLALGLATVTYLAVNLLYRSDFGTILDSINEDERLGRALGVDALRYRVVVFVLSSVIAGLCGSVYAHYLTFLSPDGFSFDITVTVILINVLGGITSPLGVVVGALILVPLPELLRDTQEYQVLIYGALLILLQFFMPDGIAGLLPRRAMRTGPA